MASDRLYVATEVDRLIRYLGRDVRDLAEVLRGETLSEAYHEELTRHLELLKQTAERARPRKAEAA